MTAPASVVLTRLAGGEVVAAALVSWALDIVDGRGCIACVVCLSIEDVENQGITKS